MSAPMHVVLATGGDMNSCVPPSPIPPSSAAANVQRKAGGSAAQFASTSAEPLPCVELAWAHSPFGVR